MEVILFTILSYGITNIAVFGSIFNKWRDFWVRISPNFFGQIFTCPMCLSFYIGLILSLIFTYIGVGTPFTEYGFNNLFLLIFLDACFTSGIVWLLHTGQEFLERAFANNEE